MPSKKTIDTPVLDRLLAEGLLWIEGREYVGRASDGEIVSIGTISPYVRAGCGESGKHEDFEGRAEAYLVDHPTPDTW